MSGIIDFAQNLSEEYGFESKFTSRQYGATLDIFNDEGELLLSVTQNYDEPTITVWSWMNDHEDTFDDWDETSVMDEIEDALYAW